MKNSGMLQMREKSKHQIRVLTGFFQNERFSSGVILDNYFLEWGLGA